MSISAHGELPSVQSTIRLKGRDDLEHIQWYDVKFYPYTPPSEDPVFAVVGRRFCFVCRCLRSNTSAAGIRTPSIEVLRRFEDQKDEGSYNSVAWSQAENGDPLVCIAGVSSQIKVLNVTTGLLVTTLVGHGAEVNDLAVSPIDPTILASGSIDHGIRLWSLDPVHARQPLAARLYGQAHREQILTLAYHRKGRYLLSGAMDTKICLWIVPDDLKSYPGTDKPAMIHYPHFSTTEIHKGYVDCIKWYNDLIISSASEEDVIQLWKIDNFASDRLPPNPAPIPFTTTVSSHERVTMAASESKKSATQSAWGGKFQRLRQFDLRDGHNSFYMRFSLFHQPGFHPVLVAGTTKSKICFWDLYEVENMSANEPVTTTLTKMSARGIKSVKKMDDSHTAGPFLPIKAHQEHVLSKYETLFRQFAWSNDGRWCVGAGEFSIITMMKRWEE